MVTSLPRPPSRPGAGLDPGRVAVGRLLRHADQPHQGRRGTRQDE